MKIEHVAFNVEDPVAVARWYVEHLGFSIKRRFHEPPFGHFLADDSGAVMIELYGNRQAPIPDYQAQPFLVLHLALVSSDVDADVQRLAAAGATLLGEIQRAANGDEVANLRDPWGFALQLVKRGEPMI